MACLREYGWRKAHAVVPITRGTRARRGIDYSLILCLCLSLLARGQVSMDLDEYISLPR